MVKTSPPPALSLIGMMIKEEDIIMSGIRKKFAGIEF